MTSTTRPSTRRKRTSGDDVPTQITTHTVAVTPALAAQWLGRNLINRKLRPDRVARYVASINGGHWTIGNDDICFDPDGYLLNGQHRLTAVVQTGKTVTMTIKRNVPRAAMAHMDRGAARTFADQLSFMGEEHSNNLAAVLRLALALYLGVSASVREMSAISDDMMVDFLEEHPNLRHSTAVGVAAAKGSGRVMCSATSLAVAHWLICEAGNDMVLADRFLHQLRTRANEPVGSAILAADNRLRHVVASKQKFAPRDYVVLLLKTWNAWAVGRSVSKFEIARKGGQFDLPKIERWAR
jgi:hypothetical protein